MKYKKIAIIIGTKAELIKCMPIMKELEKEKIDYYFIHTGQHPLGKACREFGVKEPDYILSKEPEITTKFFSKINNSSIFWSLSMVGKIKKLIKKLKPDYVLYHGDTMSTAIASIASSRPMNLFSKKWKNIHLEAGLRSGSLLEPFPEEISRRISDLFSNILFAVSDLTENNLKKSRKKGIFGKVVNMGNTIVDSANIVYELSKKKSKVKKLPNEFALINIHRHEHLRKKENMEKIVGILEGIGIEAIWPLHDNTKYYLEKYGLMEKIKKMKNIKITPLTDYFTFINYIANSKYLITDGGSIQEESLVFKKPCLILRNVTERQEGLKSGINFLTKLNVEESLKKIKEIEENLEIKDFKNPYGEPGVSKKIIEFLFKD